MKWLQKIAGVGRGVVDLIFPRSCLHCHQLLEADSPIPVLCPTCIESLTRQPSSEHLRTHMEENAGIYYDRLCAVFEFDEVCQSLIHGLKYGKMPSNGLASGRYARKFLSGDLIADSSAQVLPVPLHPLRELERGYNQSELLARGIFEDDPSRIVCDILRRTRHTPSQTRLNAAARKRNIRDAFALDTRALHNGTRFILLDDVFTTGATLNECARVLKRHRAGEVVAVAFAAVTDPQQAYGWKNGPAVLEGLRECSDGG